MNNWKIVRFSKQVTAQQGVATKRLMEFLQKLQLNKKGRSVTGMSMYKTSSCEMGRFILEFKVTE